MLLESPNRHVSTNRWFNLFAIPNRNSHSHVQNISKNSETKQGKLELWNSPWYGATIIYAMRRINVIWIRRINTTLDVPMIESMAPSSVEAQSSWLRTCTDRAPEALCGNKKLTFYNRSLVMQRTKNRVHLSYHFYSVLEHKPSTRSKYSVNFRGYFTDMAPTVQNKYKACSL